MTPLWIAFLKKVAILLGVEIMLVIGFYYLLEALKDNFFPGEIPYVYRFVLVSAAIAIVVIIIRIILGKSYDALQGERHKRD